VRVGCGEDNVGAEVRIAKFGDPRGEMMVMPWGDEDVCMLCVVCQKESEFLFNTVRRPLYDREAPCTQGDV
jgi:hypothetical protein